MNIAKSKLKLQSKIKLKIENIKKLILKLHYFTFIIII